MTFIDKINFVVDSLSLRLNGCYANGEKPYEDEEILEDYGVPERAYIIYDSDKNETKIRLLEYGECYGEKTVKGNKSDYYLDLYTEECGLADEDVVTITTLKGGLSGKAKVVSNPQKSEGLSAFTLDADSRAALGRALLQMQSEKYAPKIYLDGPLKLSPVLFPEGKEATMGFYSFLAEGLENDVNGFDILDNLSRIDAKAFTEDAIDSVVVSKDRTCLTFNSKENKYASLNLVSGRRTVYDSQTGLPVMADSNGPVIKQ